MKMRKESDEGKDVEVRKQDQGRSEIVKGERNGKKKMEKRREKMIE